jgi:hypothetical protein
MTETRGLGLTDQLVCDALIDYQFFGSGLVIHTECYFNCIQINVVPN